MFKEILEAANHAFGVTREIELGRDAAERQEEAIKELRETVRVLSQKVERIAFDLELMNERAEADRKQAKSDRENLLLQLQVAMLKFERGLPPAERQGDNN